MTRMTREFGQVAFGAVVLTALYVAWPDRGFDAQVESRAWARVAGEGSRPQRIQWLQDRRNAVLPPDSGLLSAPGRGKPAPDQPPEPSAAPDGPIGNPFTKLGQDK